MRQLGEDLRYLMDKEWFLHCGKDLKAVRINRPLSAFRVTESSKIGASVMRSSESLRQKQESKILKRMYGRAANSGAERSHLLAKLRCLALRAEYLARKSRFALHYGVNLAKVFGQESRRRPSRPDAYLKITYVGSFTGQGGAERCTFPVAQWLSQRGHEVRVHLLKPLTSSEILHGFLPAVVQRRPGRIGALGALRSLNAAVTDSDVIVSASEFTPTFVSWCFSRFHRTPFCAEVHSNLTAIRASPLQKQFARALYPKMGWIRCVSNGVSRDLADNFRIPESRIRVIHNPFDLKAIERQSACPVRPEHENLFGIPVVLAIGRLTMQKRFDLAIDALSSMRSNHGVEVRLLIIGEGELAAALEAHAIARGVTDYVQLIGFVDNPYAYLRRADVLLLSSDYEGFGRVIVEAMVVGCPVVSTDCPSGPSDIIDDGVSGVLVPVGSVDAMAGALARVLGDSSYSTNIANAARDRTTSFAVEHVAAEYEAFLREVVASARRHG